MRARTGTLVTWTSALALTVALGGVARADDVALPDFGPDGKAASPNEPAEAQVEAPTDIDLEIGRAHV